MARSKNLNLSFALTANDLTSGDVVFWSTAKGWMPTLNAADIVRSEEEKSVLDTIGKSAEARNKVVGAYLVGLLKTDAGSYKAHALREARRIAGPSITLPGQPLQHAA